MRKIPFLVVFILIGIIATVAFQIFMKNKREITFHIWSSPTSADPLEYDLAIHHEVFRSTFSSIVSQYKRGEYVGILAERWEVKDNFQTWEFYLRANLKFENGDLISSDSIKKSILRIAYLMKKNKSHDGFLEFIKGFDSISHPNAAIDGLKIQENKIIFSFVKPMQNVLEQIAFGLYSIAHPNDYDHVTGAWKNPKKFISSGPYRAQEWSDKYVVLQLRADYLPVLGHPRKFETIRIVWEDKNDASVDIYAGLSFDEVNNSYTFSGGTPSGIWYLHCLSWKSKDSPLANRALRRSLRDLFYSELERLGQKITRSFLPLAIPGIAESQTPKSENKIESKGKEININYGRRGPTVFREKFRDVWENLSVSNEIPLNLIKLESSELFKLKDPNLTNYPADISAFGTNILVEAPSDDIRFMFLSKEGIKLPDESGKIADELKKANLDYAKINNLLWEDAIIWPISHFSQGLWIKEFIDLSMLNALKPPIDFFWVGSK